MELAILDCPGQIQYVCQPDNGWVTTFEASIINKDAFFLLFGDEEHQQEHIVCLLVQILQLNCNFMYRYLKTGAIRYDLLDSLI